MSNMVMSQDASPSAMVQSPLSNGLPEFQFNNSVLNGSTAWANTFAYPAPTGQDTFRAANFFGAQMGQPPPTIPPTIPLPNRSTQKYNGPYNFQVLPTPLKSRVETQIPIRLALRPLPAGITRLHLPTHTISKPKLLAKPTPERSSDMLELCVTLVCTSAMEATGMKKKALERAASHPQRYLPPRKEDGELSPQNGGDVRICDGCITRERKRAARKKIKKPEEEKIWSQDEEHRVVVFNCQEVKEWVPFPDALEPVRPDLNGPGSTMYLEVPMRIACYCRHHSEKMGFNVIFTLKDYKDRVIAQAMSNPIMITDDHKTHLTAPAPTAVPERPVASISANPAPPVDANNLVRPAQNGGFHVSLSNGDLAAMQRNGQVNYQSPGSGKTTPTAATSHNLSRPASPGLIGPATKKRKASGSRLPDGLTMTRLDTSPSPSAQGAGSQISAATSPFTPSLNAFSQADARFAQQNVHAPFATGPSTPNSNDFASFHNSNRSASMDNLSMAQLYSAPASKHPSRAPSPNGLRNSVASTNQFARELMSNVFTSPTNLNQPRAPPIMHKIIPNEGPTVGGIEVTVLGAGFHQGLEVWFGNNKATTTTFWGESSLVCLLPPSESTGVVPVRFNSPAAHPARAAGNPATLLFKYIDVNEDQLIRTALTILGQKMQGPSLGAPELARRILQFSSSMSGGLSAGQAAGGHVFNHASYAHLESQLLKCLDLIDLDDSPNFRDLDLTQSAGHTMLHLACSLGYHRFVAALLARGADPNAQDKGGYTPLHFAAINNQPELARRLILSGANASIRTISGLTATDVATTRSVLRAMRRSKRHVRSRSSGGSLHSRTSSATSLRSLWEPMTKIHTHDEPLSVDSSEESPEYTSGDFEDEDPDEDTYLTMRRSSGFARDLERPVLRRESASELEETLASPASAITAAVKEQFQQLMAMHFPQMQFGLPGIPMLPDYQAYLQQAPFMRRVTQLMPGMGGRPNTGQGEATKTEGHWWDVSSYKSSTTTLPPAYDEIFPQDQRDEKQASACLAAAEAEADVKCASLYDQAQSSVSTVEESQTVEHSEVSEVARSGQTEAPEILKIGRKNQITREQRQQFLRAKEEKLKRLSNDRNLFFIWVSLSC